MGKASEAVAEGLCEAEWLPGGEEEALTEAEERREGVGAAEGVPAALVGVEATVVVGVARAGLSVAGALAEAQGEGAEESVGEAAVPLTEAVW